MSTLPRDRLALFDKRILALCVQPSRGRDFVCAFQHAVYAEAVPVESGQKRDLALCATPQRTIPAHMMRRHTGCSRFRSLSSSAREQNFSTALLVAGRGSRRALLPLCPAPGRLGQFPHLHEGYTCHSCTRSRCSRMDTDCTSSSSNSRSFPHASQRDC